MSVVSIAPGEIRCPRSSAGVVEAAEFSDPSADMAHWAAPGAEVLTTCRASIQPTGYPWKDADQQGEVGGVAGRTSRSIVQARGHGGVAALYPQDARTGTSQDLVTLVTKHGVTVVETPREVFDEILKAWDKVADRKSKENPFFAKVLESQEGVGPARGAVSPLLPPAV